MKSTTYFQLLLLTALTTSPMYVYAMNNENMDQNQNGNVTTTTNTNPNNTTTNTNAVTTEQQVITPGEGYHNIPIKKPSTRAEIPTPSEDATITASIKKWIDKSKVLSDLNIGVATQQGIVTLTGTVNSDSEASALVELSSSIIGVRDVNTSNLKVKGSTQPLKDFWITAKVKGVLIREEIFGKRDVAPYRVVVETKNGIVYLTGTVDNQQQITNAIELVKKVDGVKQVVYKFSKLLPQQQPDSMMQYNGDATHTETSTTQTNGTMNNTTETNTNTTTNNGMYNNTNGTSNNGVNNTNNGVNTNQNNN